MNTYKSGTLVRSSATFTNVNGAAANPDTVTVKYQAGNGTVHTATPAQDSTGTYHYDIDTSGFSGPGLLIYTVEWIGTGAVQVVDGDSFKVEAPAL